MDVRLASPEVAAGSVIAPPDVVHAALTFDQQLVDIGGRGPDMGIGGP
jgi:hypothetical protein